MLYVLKDDHTNKIHAIIPRDGIAVPRKWLTFMKLVTVREVCNHLSYAIVIRKSDMNPIRRGLLASTKGFCNHSSYAIVITSPI